MLIRLVVLASLLTACARQAPVRPAPAPSSQADVKKLPCGGGCPPGSVCCHTGNGAGTFCAAGDCPPLP